MSAHKIDSTSVGDDLKASYDIHEGAYPQTHLASNFEPAYIVDHHAERALCRKFDFRLLPVLALMYLFNALDKGNLGNAKTDGLEKDLHFESNQYNIILSVFYVPYVLCAPPLASVSFRSYIPNSEANIRPRAYWGRDSGLLESCQS
jgi:hypothetical protein